MTAVLEADSLYRFFHAGDDETLALQGVSLAVAAGRGRRGHRPVGLGQVDAAGLPRRARRARRRHGAHRRRAALAPPRGGSARALRARGIGVLYQQANLVGPLSVAGNVALAQRLAGAPAGAGADDRCWSAAASPAAPTPVRASCPAASSRAPGWRSRWPTTRGAARRRADRRARRAPPPSASSSCCASAPTAGAAVARRHPQPRGRGRRRPRDPPARRAGRGMSEPATARPLRRRRAHLRHRRRPRPSRSSRPTARSRAGDRIALVGPSGSGKSTLLHLWPGSTTRPSGP